MKNISLTRGLVLGLALLAANSCTNLDEELYSKVTSENFGDTDEEKAALLAKPYTVIYPFMGHNNYFSMQEVASDEAMIPQRGGDWGDGGQWFRVHRHEYNADEQVVGNIWASCYNAINSINPLLKTALSASDPDEGLVAELKVLRALYYYFLMDVYGNVPLVGDNGNEGQKTRSEIYDFVVSEITSNAAALTKDVNLTYGRLNYYSAHALLAKVYLNAGVYKTGNGANGNWDGVIAACDEIINSGEYTLVSDYAAVFSADNAQNAEHIFAIPYDEVFAKGFNLTQMTFHYETQKTFKLEAQPWNGYCSVAEFYDSYDNADVRKTNNFMAGIQRDATGADLVDPQVEATDPDGPVINFTPAVNELAPNALRQAGARLAKFRPEIGALPDMNNDFPLFRYADVLMMKAEALWRKNNADATALALVNQIRARAGVADFAALDADNFLAERGREFAFETHRRQDLIRFGKYNDAWTFKPASDATKNICPIPRTQIEAAAISGTVLNQNPGYN